MTQIARWIRLAPAAVTLLLLALASCPPDAACDLVQVAKVPLALENHVFVSHPPQRTIKMLLDTGARNSLLGEAVVQRLNLPRDANSYTSIKGLTGSSDSPDATASSMSIDTAALPIDRLPVSSFGGNQPFDGILGLDILGKYDVDIDGPKRMLTLYRARRCASATPPWDEPAVPVSGFSARTGWLGVARNTSGIKQTVSWTLAHPTRFSRRLWRNALGLSEQALARDQMIPIHLVAGDDTPSRVH